MKTDIMEKTMYITVSDYERITGSNEFISLQKQSPEIADRLLKELRAARTFPSERIAKNIVTMNSRVQLKELQSGREIQITLTYPDEADPKEQKISVFTPIGVALLGCQEGDITSWRIPSRVGRFKVERVVYQPEAEGHFNL